MDRTLLLALAPVAMLLAAFAGYCLWDLSRAQVRLIPRWAWALAIVVSIPFGGILYLLAGRQDR